MRQRLARVAEVALGRQRTPQHEQGDHMVPYLRSANIVDGVLDLSDVKAMNFSPTEQALFSLRGGDVLVTEGSGSRETVGASAVWREELPGTVCYQNTLLRVRPRAGVSDGRFLAWWLRHVHASGLIAEFSTGANILHLGADTLRSMLIELPTLQEQRRAAAFLDGQIASLDKAVKARERQSQLIAERTKVVLRKELLGRTSRRVRLRSLILDERLGAWGDEPDGVHDVRVARVADFDRETYSIHEIPTLRSLPYPRTRLLRRGDVLLERSGGTTDRPVGAVVTYENDSIPTVTSNFVSRLRPQPGVDGRYLTFLMAALYEARVNAAYYNQTTGIQNLDSEAYLHVDVPFADTAEQTRLSKRVDSMLRESLEARDHIERSLQLLRERKRALITAAVTGQIDVTTASGRGVA